MFIDHNHLKERFTQLEAPHFIIAETGFGTGLNFLNAWQLWRDCVPENKKLYFISTEKHPVSPEDLKQCLSAWPQHNEISSQLLNNYPLLIEGLHCIELSDGVTLLLWFGDAAEGLQQLIENDHPNFSYAQQRAVDAWFLDGFAPSKNPDMWQPALFKGMAKLSKASTSLSSFTAAGKVRRGLQEYGFDIKKTTGYGKKREMIIGEYKGLPSVFIEQIPSTRTKPYTSFWQIYRHQQPQAQQSSHKQTAIIIGAGIAGCTTARVLAEAGIKVTVLEKNNAIMSAASGNPQAVLFPKLSHKSSDFSDFNLSSLLYAIRFYQHYAPQAFHQCGLLQLLNNKDQKNAEHLVTRFYNNSDLINYVDARKASRLCGTAIQYHALYYPQLGWLDTQEVGQLLTQHKNIDIIHDYDSQSIIRDQQQWLVNTQNKGTLSADNVIVCNAFAANELLPNMCLPLNNIRGQISQARLLEKEALSCVVCHDGYICPSYDNRQTASFGASYELKNNNTDISKASQQTNIETLLHYLPNIPLDLHQSPSKDSPQGRVGFRCSAPDYMPIIGPVPDTQFFSQHYATLNKNSKAFIPITGSYQQGLFVNTAYGSRGFSSAPLGAALLRSYLLQQPYALTQAMLKAVHPARFFIRDIIRR